MMEADSENRTHFALEVIDAMVQRVGENKTAIRLGPWVTSMNGGTSYPFAWFYVSSVITRMGLPLIFSFVDLTYLYLE